MGKCEMRVYYAPQRLPSFQSESPIFLVGPTPREISVPSWRPEALSILEHLGYDGIVLVPEPEDGNWPKSFLEQVEWEHQGLEAASDIRLCRRLGSP